MESSNFFILVLIITYLGVGCNTPEEEGPTIPAHQLQVFEIDATQDTSIRTQNNALLVIPACAFEGKKKVTIEFAEFYNPADFVEAGLTTVSSDKKMLESAGMFYFNAQTAEGQAIPIAASCAPLLRVPSNSTLPNLKKYTGKKEDGNIVWENPEDLEKWLTPVPLSSLRLYGNPNKTYRGKQGNFGSSQRPRATFIQVPGKLLYCGLDNKIVDTLYSSVFENTLIATIEFEARMKLIHKSCSEELLQIYLSNLDKNLYEIDRLAYQYLQEKDSTLAANFYTFYEQKLTKIKDGNAVHEVYVDAIAQNPIPSFKAWMYNTMSFNRNGWCNFDTPMTGIGYQIKEVITLRPPADIDFVTATVYVVLKKYNSLCQLSRKGDPLRFSGDYFWVGDNEVALYAVASDGQQTYTALKEITVGEEKKYTLNLVPSDIETIKSTLSKYGTPREENRITPPEKTSCCFFDWDYSL